MLLPTNRARLPTPSPMDVTGDSTMSTGMALDGVRERWLATPSRKHWPCRHAGWQPEACRGPSGHGRWSVEAGQGFAAHRAPVVQVDDVLADHAGLVGAGEHPSDVLAGRLAVQQPAGAGGPGCGSASPGRAGAFRGFTPTQEPEGTAHPPVLCASRS